MMLESNDIEIRQEISSAKPSSASLALSELIFHHCKYSDNKDKLINQIKNLLHQQPFKISLDWPLEKVAYRLGIIVISILSKSKTHRHPVQRSIKTEEHHCINHINEPFISVTDVQTHMSINFIQYFCNMKMGDLISCIKLIKLNLMYQSRQKGQVLEIVPTFSFIRYLHNFKYTFNCYCPNIVDIDQIYRCQKCLTSFHRNCQSQLLLCGRCYLLELSMESKPVEEIALFYLTNTHLINSLTFKLEGIQQQKMNLKKKYHYELRVDRMIRQNTPQQQMKEFLSNYIIILNHQLINKMSLISSISQRPTIKIPHRYFEEENVLIIKKKNKKVHKSNNHAQTYILGIFKAEPHPNKIKPITIIQQQSINFITSIYMRDKSIQVITLTDQRTNQRIKTPVRGYNCSHFQCFDLQSFIEEHKPFPMKRKFKKGIIKQKDQTKRKIKRKQKKVKLCPICHETLFNIYIDPIYKHILQSYAQEEGPKCIQISENGEFTAKQVKDKAQVIEIL